MIRLWTAMDPRLRLAAAAVIIAFVLPLAWYLGSPLFLNVTVNERPGTRILILSMYSDEQYVRNAIDAGAHGYILKGSNGPDMVKAVRAVAAGQQYVSPELSGALIRAWQAKTAQGETDPYDRLTQREKQVLQLIAQGKSNKEIAVLLDLSVNTVAVHRANLMNTLQLHKAAELVLFAVKKGLVIPE